VRPSKELASVGESRIDDFDATRYANVRGLRLYNRTTRLGISVAKLALADAGLSTAELPAEQLGIVTASTFGHMDTLLEYDRGLVTLGLQRTNPALMPLGLPSAPGAVIALSLGAKAFSFGLSDGAAASLDALGLGARLLESDRGRVCIVVGAFSICREVTLSAAREGSQAPAEQYRVFDRRRCGTVFGEAAGAVVLEKLADAKARGGVVKGVIRGQSSSFAARGTDPDKAVRRACASALRVAEVEAREITLISAGANGSVRDRAQAAGLAAVLGQEAGRPPVMAVKANFGEMVDASGIVQTLAALLALQAGHAPSILDLEEPDIPSLNYARGREGASVVRGCALVTSLSNTGSCSALVLSGAP
jgi:3-oxoacyl-[acyl-carrier-protein] synthase II